MAKSTRRRLTDDERAQRRAQDRERLEQAARDLLTSEGWRRWVRVRARNGLARYSLTISGRLRQRRRPAWVRMSMTCRRRTPPLAVRPAGQRG